MKISGPFKHSLGGLIIAMITCFSSGLVYAQQERFVISADGKEVTDTQSKLVWQRCSYGQQWDGKTCAGKPVKVTLEKAKQLAAESATWHVPTKTELTSLVDKSQKKKPVIDKAAFPGTPSAMFWALRPEKDDKLNAWIVDFSKGKVYGNTHNSKYMVRLARAS